MADYLKLLRELATIEPPLFVFGSVAEAALLDGRLDPSHGDVDLLTPRTEVDESIPAARDFGFAQFHVYLSCALASPCVCKYSGDDLVVELSVLDYDSAGMPYFALPADGAVVAVALPSRRVRVATDDRQRGAASIRSAHSPSSRSGLAGMTTGAFGPTRPQDTTRQARLIETFFPDSDPTSLEPRITTLGELE